MKVFYIILVVLSGISSCSREFKTPVEEKPDWTTERVIAPNTEQVIFYSQSAKSAVSFHIFLPDEYQDDTTGRFPVIYWLHGSGNGTAGIIPLVSLFKDAMDQHKIPSAIIVFPYGLPYGMWCNSKDGRQPVETMFVDDLIPFVDSNYRTIISRNGRIVEGFSMGGYGSARFGFKYASLFGGFSMLAAGPLQLDFSKVAPQNQAMQTVIFKDVYGDDMDYFVEQSPWRLAELYGQGLPDPTPKRVVVGRLDYVYEDNKNFHHHLDSMGIPHQFREFDNIGHNVPPLLKAMGESNWLFYNAVFR